MSNTTNHTNFQIGDTVWFDHIDFGIPLHGRIKTIIHDDSIHEDRAEIVVGRHGIGKVTKGLAYVYPSKQAYDAAKKAESERTQAEYYEETATVEGLLHFLSCQEMLCKGEASDDAWAVIQRRLKESDNKRRRRKRRA